MRREIRDELDQIAAESGDGRLRADAIVERARKKDSVLHGHFTWEDSAAAKLWRIEEARVLIRSYHVVVRQQPPMLTRAFVSLRPDRLRGGGYLPVETILGDRELHQQLLDDALAELAAVERRYAHIAELHGVWEEIKKVRRRAPRDKGVVPAQAGA